MSSTATNGNTVLRLKAPLLTEEQQKELDEFLARLCPPM